MTEYMMLGYVEDGIAAMSALRDVAAADGNHERAAHLAAMHRELTGWRWGWRASGGGGVMSLELQPISFPEACAFIRQHHRHHIPPVGWKFGIAVNDGERVVGVITVGRPVARHLDDGWTLEANRCCTDGTANAASMLYAAAWRAARAMGYRRLITYTLAEEPGTSLRAAGWRELYTTQGGSWNVPSRPRVDKHPTGQKTLWEAAT